MESYYIKGGKPLCGEIDISGAKNATLPILAASVITKGENLLSSCPDISDVDSMIKILTALGCRISKDADTVSVDASNISGCKIPTHLMGEMRSSVFLAGSLLARCGEAVISNPGGCNIGKRPIDIHIKGLEQLGVTVDRKADRIVLKAGRLQGTQIKLDYPSVGATENILLAAIAAEGTTVIENSAREPEITDLQKYINSCGGNVHGAGTGRITIEGGALQGSKKLRGCNHRMIADRIEAGTYLLMSLGTGGDVFLKGIEDDMLLPLIKVLRQGGYDIRCDDSGIRAKTSGRENICCKISTQPYPGFPTDLQPQMVSFLTKNGAGSIIEENIFENRIKYAKQLRKMGADIEIFEKQVIIKSNKILYGSRVDAEDLRGGAALVIASLMATGDSVIGNTRYIKRGYSKFKEKILLLGGEIKDNGQ